MGFVPQCLHLSEWRMVSAFILSVLFEQIKCSLCRNPSLNSYTCAMTSQSLQPQWQTIRDRKLADVASRIPTEWLIPPSKLPSASVSNVTFIPRTCGILTSKEIHITEAYTARSLLSALLNCDFTAVEVTTAFCKVSFPSTADLLPG